MASHRERVLDALKARFAVALPGATVTRGGKKPKRLNGAGGDVVIGDGDPGPPEEFFSPHSYTYNHRFPLDVAAFESSTLTRNQALDVMLLALDAAVGSDRTLGGLCEWMEFEAPAPDDGVADGTEPFRWAEVALTCVYTTTSPLA